MRQPSSGKVLDLVLIGGGHSHVHVIRMIGMLAMNGVNTSTTWWQWLWDRLAPRSQQRPSLEEMWPLVQVTLISRDIMTPYSGMLPGFVAHHYSYDEIHLDLSRLCRWAGIRFIHAAASRITYQERGGWVYCADDRPPFRYDCLSIDIGIAPSAAATEPTSGLVPVKPISQFGRQYQTLREQWRQRVCQWLENPTLVRDSVFCIAVVGAGAGGIEMALSMQYNLLQIQQDVERAHQTERQHKNVAGRRKDKRTPSDKHHATTKPMLQLKVLVVTRGATILPNHNRRVQRIFQRILSERGVDYHVNTAVTSVVPVSVSAPEAPAKYRLTVASPGAAALPLVDQVVWCTTAQASSWLTHQTPFSTTATGFIRVHPTYQAIHHPGVFAAGDCCHMDQYPRPKGTLLLTCHRYYFGLFAF
jgi:selenide, water dikinase